MLLRSPMIAAEEQRPRKRRRQEAGFRVEPQRAADFDATADSSGLWDGGHTGLGGAHAFVLILWLYEIRNLTASGRLCFSFCVARAVLA